MYRGLACPWEGIPLHLLNVAGRTYARTMIHEFVARRGIEIAASSTGLLPVLEEWPSQDDDLASVWDPIIRVLQRGICGASAEVTVAAAVALRLGAYGKEGVWEAQLPGAVRLRWDNWLLPEAEKIRVESDGRFARLWVSPARSRAPQEVILAHEAGGWVCTGADRLVTLRSGRPIVLLPKHALVENGPAGEQEWLREGVDSIDWRVTALFQSGVDTLRACSPEYGLWVDTVVREIVPREHKGESALESGSARGAPGLMTISICSEPVLVGEMMVHEASHMYFHMGSLIAPIDDGTDETLYYSPAVGRRRPLQRILLAYHAFGNVLLFYRDCRQQGVGNHIRSTREASLRPKVQALESPLRENPALTELGQSLFEPLQERLAL